jgi:uncharacterized protein YbjT (DUF2867 family)
MKPIGKSALVMGATGLVGMELLKQLIDNPEYYERYVVGRRAPALLSPKITFRAIDLSEIGTLPFTDVDDVYCALGTTIKKAGSQNAFRLVDFDAVVDLAHWAKIADVKHFAMVSSIGAKATSKNFYLRTKGQMEQRVMQIGLQSLIIVRPSLLLGKRNEMRLGEKLGQWLSTIMNPLLWGKLKKYQSVKASKVANAMIAYSQSKFGDTYIVESDQLQLF